MIYKLTKLSETTIQTNPKVAINTLLFLQPISKYL